MVAATLAGLSYAGSMREISKRDIWSPQRVAQERPDVDYKLIAIDFLPVKVVLSFALHLQVNVRSVRQRLQAQSTTSREDQHDNAHNTSMCCACPRPRPILVVLERPCPRLSANPFLSI